MKTIGIIPVYKVESNIDSIVKCGLKKIIKHGGYEESIKCGADNEVRLDLE